MRDGELERQITKLIIEGTGSPTEALEVVASVHLAILHIALKWVKENQGKDDAAELSAEHFDVLLKTLASFTDEMGLQEGTMQKMIGKIKHKLKDRNKDVGNFKTFVEVLGDWPKAGNKNVSGEFQQLICRDWNFKFPISAWIQGKAVSLVKSVEIALQVEIPPTEIDGARFEQQFQLVDTAGSQYLAFLCKKKTLDVFEYPLYVVKKGGEVK